jgi:hypothetical protein
MAARGVEGRALCATLGARHHAGGVWFVGGEGVAPEEDHLEKRRLDRMLFFSDAVFAIALTLLVLDLKPPHLPGPIDFSALSGPLSAFLLSFVVTCAFWAAHVANTQRLCRFDWPTAFANLAFLLPVCLIPFVSAWIGGALDDPRGWTVYYAVMILCSAAEIAMVVLETRGGGRLIAGGMTKPEQAYRIGRSASPGCAFVVGLLAGASGHVRLAQFAWAFIPVFLGVCELALKPKTARAAA